MTLRPKLFYGVGSVAYGVKDNGFSFFLLIYYNQVLGLSAIAAGTALMDITGADPGEHYLNPAVWRQWLAKKKG